MKPSPDTSTNLAMSSCNNETGAPKTADFIWDFLGTSGSRGGGHRSHGLPQTPNSRGQTMFWPPPNRPVGLPSQYRINWFYWFCDLKTQKSQSNSNNNNLGIEALFCQLHDESGPVRIDQSPEWRIIASHSDLKRPDMWPILITGKPLKLY